MKPKYKATFVLMSTGGLNQLDVSPSIHFLRGTDHKMLFCLESTECQRPRPFSTAAESTRLNPSSAVDILEDDSMLILDGID